MPVESSVQSRQDGPVDDAAIGSAPRNGRPVLWGVFLLSLGLLLFELSLTRVLSVLFYYHTAFVAISVALLGLAAGALWVHLAPALFAKRLGAIAAAAGLCMALAALVFRTVQLKPEQLEAYSGAPFLVSFTLTVVACLVPFLGGGIVLAALFRTHRDRVARLYAADLIGGSLGTLLLIPAMELLGGPAALIASGAVVALSSLLFGGKRWGLVAVALLGVVMAAQLRADVFAIDVELTAQERTAEEPRILAKKWNAFSRVVALDGQGWDRGLSTRRWNELQGRLASQIEAVIDINAFAPLIRFDGDLEAVGYLRDVVSNIGYHLMPEGRRVAIIGSGGGKDVVGALLFRPETVTAIELNPILVEDFARGRFRDFTGGIYDHPRVQTIVGEARAVLGQLDQDFDLIVANSVATWAAHSSGALNLSEQSLFTDAAFRLYFERLAPGGLLSFSLWDDDRHAIILRLLSTAEAAAEGLEPLAGRVAVITNRWEYGGLFTTVLISNRPLSADQVTGLRDLTEALGFELLYAPGEARNSDSAFHRYLRHPAGFTEAFRYTIDAPTDDRPFFFYTLRLGDALRVWDSKARTENAAYFSLVFTMGLVAMLVGAILGLPLWRARRRTGAGGGLSSPDVLYFACLGSAFMLIEISLIQRLTLLLGHPTYALTVVLFAILASSGLGSLWVGSWCRAPGARRRLGVILVMLLPLLAAGWWSLPLILENAFSQASVLPRVATAFAVIIPIGFLMGIPFPTALHTIGRRSGHAVPWALAVNGATGVLASVAAILIAVQWGFSAAFGLGIGFYALALFTRPRVT